jgi:trehalose synthase-fused probable maltokinase
MFKAIRKIEAGIHPELEMTDFLSEQLGFKNVPTLLGSVDCVDANGIAATICILQALVPNQGDGWHYTIREMVQISQGDTDRSRLEKFAHQLGRRTAELHQALAQPAQDKAFAPQPATECHLSAWRAEINAQAQTALAGLERARASLDQFAREQAGRLLADKRTLIDRALGLIPRHLPVHLTRLHGDYHLGQVLVTQDDVFIIDFEGEPLRPLAERRLKHLPLRDVAGMLRSFTYAASAAERQAGVGPSGALRELSWKASEAFLAGYHRAIRGCPSFPSDLARANDLLHAFMLEKALYEIDYEVTNRPDWITIPLSSILSLLNGEEVPRFPEVAAASNGGLVRDIHEVIPTR